MANVITLQFRDNVEARVSRNDYTGDRLDYTDIEYALGTNFGATSYINVSSTGLVSASSLSQAFDRNESTVTSTLSSATWTYNQHVVNISDVVMRIVPTSAIPTTFQLQARNQFGAWIPLQEVTVSSTTDQVIEFRNCDHDFTCEEIRIVRVSGTSNFQLYEIHSYGYVKSDENIILGSLPAPTSIETIADSRLNTLVTQSKGAIDYRQTLDAKDDITFETIRLTLSSNYTIPSDLPYTVLTIDPNGVNRDVILPQTPQVNHYVKIISVDGNNFLEIKETSAGSSIVSLSNSTGTLTAEFTWNSTNQTWEGVA